jgi:hypothetical protein
MGKPVRKEKKLLLTDNLQAGCFSSFQSGRTFWFVKADFIDLHGTHSCLASLAITDKGRRVMRHFDGPFFGGN